MQRKGACAMSDVREQRPDPVLHPADHLVEVELVRAHRRAAVAARGFGQVGDGAGGVRGGGVAGRAHQPLSRRDHQHGLGAAGAHPRPHLQRPETCQTGMKFIFLQKLFKFSFLIIMFQSFPLV